MCWSTEGGDSDETTAALVSLGAIFFVSIPSSSHPSGCARPPRGSLPAVRDASSRFAEYRHPPSLWGQDRSNGISSGAAGRSGHRLSWKAAESLFVDVARKAIARADLSASEGIPGHRRHGVSPASRAALRRHVAASSACAATCRACRFSVWGARAACGAVDRVAACARRGPAPTCSSSRSNSARLRCATMS